MRGAGWPGDSLALAAPHQAVCRRGDFAAFIKPPCFFVFTRTNPSPARWLYVASAAWRVSPSHLPQPSRSKHTRTHKPLARKAYMNNDKHATVACSPAAHCEMSPFHSQDLSSHSAAICGTHTHTHTSFSPPSPSPTCSWGRPCCLLTSG